MEQKHCKAMIYNGNSVPPGIQTQEIMHIHPISAIFSKACNSVPNF